MKIQRFMVGIGKNLYGPFLRIDEEIQKGLKFHSSAIFYDIFTPNRKRSEKQ